MPWSIEAVTSQMEKGAFSPDFVPRGWVVRQANILARICA